MRALAHRTARQARDPPVAVNQNNDTAIKVDPETSMVDANFVGLVGAYTNGDMTGFALRNVIPR